MGLPSHSFEDHSGEVKRWPLIEEPTADFMYVRLHGEAKLYQGRYSSKSLLRWAKKIRSWLGGSGPVRGGRDVCVYSDNDSKAAAPFDALTLAKALQSEGDRVL